LLIDRGWDNSLGARCEERGHIRNSVVHKNERGKEVGCNNIPKALIVSCKIQIGRIEIRVYY
jgi:hypothetical protein